MPVDWGGGGWRTLQGFGFSCCPSTHSREHRSLQEGCLSPAGWAPVRYLEKFCCKGSSKGDGIKLPLTVASAVNYLMNLPLQGLGFCFLQMKKEKRETQCQWHSVRCLSCLGVLFPALPLEKSASVTDLGSGKEEELSGALIQSWGQALAVSRVSC